MSGQMGTGSQRSYKPGLAPSDEHLNCVILPFDVLLMIALHRLLVLHVLMKTISRKGKAKTQSARLPESFKYNPKGEQGERTDGGSWSSRGRGPKFGNRHERNQDREGKKNGYKGESSTC